MMYSIMVIEMTINFWRVQAPSPDSVTLTPHVRALASLYGSMIHNKATEVARSSLTEGQSRAVTLAIEQLSAPMEKV